MEVSQYNIDRVWDTSKQGCGVGSESESPRVVAASQESKTVKLPRLRLWNVLYESVFVCLLGVLGRSDYYGHYASISNV